MEQMEKMNVFKNVKRSTNTITFQLSPTHVSYANTLRRLCMTHVESVGFRADIKEDGSTTDVEVLANSTPMTNEMLAHRIGLVPIHIKSPLEWDPEKYTFVLNKTNETEEFMDIYASDFQILERRGEDEVMVSASSFFKPHEVTRQTCLLAVLKPMMPGAKPEEIRIKAKATLGIGRENARFIPTAQCAYAYTRDTDPIHEKKIMDDWLVRVKKIDPAVLETDPKRKEILEREFKTLEINRCFLKNEKGEPHSFDFTIESVGVLDPEYIVLRACEKGIELCKKYSEENLGGDVIVQRADTQLSGWDFIFQKQDHTLGHLVQAWIDENLVDRGEVNYVGYDIPHPLRDEMVIRIGVSDGEEATARKALRTAMIACQGMFQSWRDQFASIVQPAQARPVQTTQATARPKVVIRRPTQPAKDAKE